MNTGVGTGKESTTDEEGLKLMMLNSEAINEAEENEELEENQ